MPNKKIEMQQIRQLIRLKQKGVSHKSIARQLGISRTTVIEYVRLMESSGLGWDQLDEADDVLLGSVLNASGDTSERYKRLLNFFPYMEKELKRTGVTRQLLWKEYRRDEEDAYAYSQFCYHFKQWSRSVNPTAPMLHKSGDKLFIDFCGEKLPVINRETGEVYKADVFVGVLGASGMTYAQASYAQKQEDVADCFENCVRFYGGVPAAVVPDNMPAIVSKSSRYEPKITQLFRQLALHYNTVFLPTRPGKPKDKSKVENGVKNVYMHVFAPLRNMQFFSLSDLNEAIQEQIDRYNHALFPSRNYSRAELFENIERKALSPLPEKPFHPFKQTRVTVQKNGHILLGEDKHFYSAPYQFIGQRVQVHYNADQVEIYANYERIAVHMRNRRGYGFTTIDDHLASTHRIVREWNPERYLRWASEVGEDTERLIERIFQSKPHPEQAYNSCDGILHLARKVGPERLNKACRRALDYDSFYYKTVKNILERGIDLQADLFTATTKATPEHQNIRGANYYQ